MSSSWGSVGFWVMEVMTFLVGNVGLSTSFISSHTTQSPIKMWFLQVDIIYCICGWDDSAGIYLSIPSSKIKMKPFFQPETNWNRHFPSIFRSIPWTNELIVFPVKGGRSGLLRVANRPKFFLPFGRLSTRHPATQIRWKKTWKKQNTKTGATRNKGGLFLDEICWAVLLEFFGGDGVKKW